MLSTVALVSGVWFAAYLVLDASGQAAAHRGADLDPGLAAYDVGSIGFANAWVAMGSFAVASGWVIVSTQAMPQWLGWWGVASGAGLAVARFPRVARPRLVSPAIMTRSH
ncbi:DUF4386 family protein [Kribbella sp. NPDC023972]|uniref:DUF4386 family protein n=1 Tax=Kribbella sp. NPDC023972 TaxID=3154795 RepID=UPI0033CD27B9